MTQEIRLGGQEVDAIVEKHGLSTLPSAWAKRSCKTCYGRGTVELVAFRTTGASQFACKCARDRFSRHVQKLRRDNEKKDVAKAIDEKLQEIAG